MIHIYTFIIFENKLLIFEVHIRYISFFFFFLTFSLFFFQSQFHFILIFQFFFAVMLIKTPTKTKIRKKLENPKWLENLDKNQNHENMCISWPKPKLQPKPNTEKNA